MSVLQFKTTQNLSLLWDVFLDELQVSHTNKELMANIRSVFESNIGPFTARANQNTSIMELNKQFLKQIVLAVNRLFPYLKQMKKITITDEELSSPYKIEDIHASRQSDFEREVEKKQMEMDSYLTLKKPQQVNFSDNNYNEKIGSMELLISEKISQRNLEILPPIQETDQWLQPKETSIKAEKIFNYDSNNNNTNNNNSNNNNSNNKLKHINIDTNNNVVLKKVTWTDEEATNNIFQKLKKVPELKQYDEQQSISLPDVKQEQIISNSNPNLNPTSNHINAFIPKNDLAVQINELNKKMDKILDILNTLIEKQK
jgi:hypothetical protein